MKKIRSIKYFRRSIVILSVLITLISVFGMACDADSRVQDYAPILYFEGEESCYPINAEFHIQNSFLYNVESTTPISTSPTESSIATYSTEIYEGMYLDNQLGTISDYNQIISTAKSWENSNGNAVYYYSFDDATTGEQVIQYWMFYAFNKGELNQHEGDWEMVQIIFSGDEPSMVGYSQHHSGQKATWSQVEKEGTHIKVYVARGSHANYLRSYSGKLGIASDFVGANGKILESEDYQLLDLESEGFLSFIGRWGEVAEDESGAIESSLLGQAGPEGPMYRENGAMWDGVSWGSSLLPANDTIFMVEWFFYNFLLIFALIAVAIIGIMAFKIYRRHKKYGLGPRIVSMFYINGFNLHSIGNILCFVGIIVAFVGLFYPWYTVSYSATGAGVTDTFESSKMLDLLSFDGINGLQLTVPGTSGPVPMGSFVIPFSALIAIGIIFMIISTIGLPLSKKLGAKYIFRGIRLIIPFILIVVLIIILGSVIPSMAGGGETSSYIRDIIEPLTSSPLGGESSTSIVESDLTALINLRWGVGMGAWMLFISGIIMIVAGILEFSSKTQFFATKVPLPGKIPPRMPVQQRPPPQQQYQQPPPPVQPPPPSKPVEPKKKKKTKDEPKTIFCPGCGSKIEANSKFCDNCGKKVD